MVKKAVKAKCPVKKAVKAKPVEAALQHYYNVIEDRYEIAKAIYEIQDSTTKEVIDRIRDRLRIAATGVININDKPHKLEQRYVDLNIWFIAVEVLNDLALNDIQMGNFKFHPELCAICKTKIGKKKRK